MARVVMFVLNDCRSDARVLREAGTLAAAGHRVTIMARTSDPYAATGERETRDGFEIVRVPVAGGVLRWMLLARQPGTLVGELRDAALRAARHPPRGWLALGVGIVSLPLVGLLAGLGALALAIVLGVIRYVPPARWAWRAVDWRLRWAFGAGLWARRAAAAAPPADVHHGHDLHGLEAAVAARGSGRTLVIYDSHEIFVEMGAYAGLPRPSKAILEARERRLAGAAAALVTINQSIADVLGARLGIRRIVLVHNTPARWTPPARPEDRIRRATGIPPACPVVLCHGSFQVNRGLDETARALAEPGLETAHLVFLGHRNRVIEPILALPHLAGRVHSLPAVEPGEVVAWVAGADVDVMAILPTDQNSLMSTPNKLFESLAAGVPVVSSDFPERRRIIVEDPGGPLGALCDPADPASIGAAIRSVLDLPPDERDALRARCLAAARERWNWEIEGGRLVGLYADLVAAGDR